jgi:carboxymethylenebutenolidase
MHTPWLGFFGDRDKSIPVDDVEALRARLDAETEVPHEVVRYASAGHGFFCDRRDSYHGESAADAWPRALAWFEAHLAKS